MGHRFVAVVVVGGLLLASCGDDSPDDASATTQIADVAATGPATPEPAVGADEFPTGMYGAGREVAVGAYAEFHEDGTGRARGMVGNSSSTLRLHDSTFTYVVDGDQVVLTATSGDCEPGATGAYRWSADGTTLDLRNPADRCVDRSLVLYADWSSLGNTPVIDVEPGGDPVRIDSPIGPIEWQIVAGQAFVWAHPDPTTSHFGRTSPPIVAIDGGFVAVVDRQTDGAPAVDAVEPRLVFSQNGIDWESIPPPPSTIGVIAADGERLYVAPAEAPDAVHVTDDRGESWTALRVEQPPPSIADLSVGRAGVVLIGSDTGLWLLGDGSFERIESIPAPLIQVLVLDTGFFALSVEDGDIDDPEAATRSYWRSDDGRTWTEVTDVPTAVLDRDTTSWGDHVYLSHWGEGTGYTSTDGGRTWSGPSTRPGEGLVVTDAGHLSVQPAIFGPVVGVVWMSSDDVDWQRVVNPWPPIWTFPPVVSGTTILVPGDIDPPSGEAARLDLVGSID